MWAFLIFAAGLLLQAQLSPATQWTQFLGAARDGRAASFRRPETWPLSLVGVWERKIGEGLSSPVIAGGTTVAHSRVGDDEVVEAFALDDGRPLWIYRYKAPVGGLSSPAQFGRGPRSTPAISGDAVLTLGVTGILSCLDLQTGQLRWRRELEDYWFRAYPEDGTAMSPLIVG